MVYYSEILKKAYDTAEECLTAEAEYTKKIKEEEERKYKLAKEKEARKEQIDSLIKEYIHDYGSYAINTDYITDLKDSNFFRDLFPFYF